MRYMMALSHRSKWSFSVLNALYLRVMFHYNVVHWAEVLQHVTRAVTQVSPWPWGSCVALGGRGALSAPTAGALTPARSPGMCWGRAAQPCLEWCVSWRRHLFCHLRQDTTLLWEWFSFRQCYTDGEKQKQSGPFAIALMHYCSRNK